jgi:hypothetical protein
MTCNALVLLYGQDEFDYERRHKHADLSHRGPKQRSVKFGHGTMDEARDTRSD